MAFSPQKKVYDDVGAGVLSNAWEGYNSTLFAYGQTGSGKSWSVVGYGINKGKYVAKFILKKRNTSSIGVGELLLLPNASSDFFPCRNRASVL